MGAIQTREIGIETVERCLANRNIQGFELVLNSLGCLPAKDSLCTTLEKADHRGMTLYHLLVLYCYCFTKTELETLIGICLSHAPVLPLIKEEILANADYTINECFIPSSKEESMYYLKIKHLSARHLLAEMASRLSPGDQKGVDILSNYRLLSEAFNRLARLQS